MKCELGYLIFANYSYINDLAAKYETKNPIEFLIANDFDYSLYYFVSTNYTNESLKNFYKSDYKVKDSDKGVKGEINPLVVAVKCKSLECTNYMLKNIISLNKDQLYEILSTFEETFIVLLSTSSRLIGDLLTRISIPKEILGFVDSSTLPLITFAGDDPNKIDEENIYNYSVEVPEEGENENLSAITSAIKFPKISGSSFSNSLIKSLTESQNPFTFRSEIIR